MSQYENQLPLLAPVEYRGARGYIAARLYSLHERVNLYDLRMDTGQVVAYVRDTDFRVLAS